MRRFVAAVLSFALAGFVFVAAESPITRRAAGQAAPPVHPAAPVKLDKAAAGAVAKAIEKDRAATREWLRSAPNSYLATVDRKDFGEKTTLTVGRAAGNDVVIDDPAIEPHQLRVTVDGDRFQVRAVDTNARFQVNGEARREATVDPSSIQVGRHLIRLSHQRFPAIIVFDPKSPRYREYKGIEYFPIDLAYRYELPLTPNPKPDIVIIMSTRGNQRRAERVGWFDFLVGGVPCRLEASRLLEPGVGEQDLGVYFRDLTTGKESYELGRYVDAVKLPSGKYLLDFNRAYNPACAFSSHYNCPVPPKANTLKVAIRAGEMDSHYH
jgi:uncharacterized protein (DUF1684 family)